MNNSRIPEHLLTKREQRHGKQGLEECDLINFETETILTIEVKDDDDKT
jgi:hypothetical protein